MRSGHPPPVIYPGLIPNALLYDAWDMKLQGFYATKQAKGARAIAFFCPPANRPHWATAWSTRCPIKNPISACLGLDSAINKGDEREDPLMHLPFFFLQRFYYYCYSSLPAHSRQNYLQFPIYMLWSICQGMMGNCWFQFRTHFWFYMAMASLEIHWKPWMEHSSNYKVG